MRLSHVCRSGVNADQFYLAGDLSLLERDLVNGSVDRLEASGLEHVICPDMVKLFIAVSRTKGFESSYRSLGV